MLGLSEKEKSAAARLRVRFIARANIEARRVCVVGPATRGSESARRNETDPRAYAREIARAGPAVARTEGSRRIFCSGTGKHSPPQREYGKGAVVSSPRPHHGELSASAGFEWGWCGGRKEGLEPWKRISGIPLVPDTRHCWKTISPESWPAPMQKRRAHT